MKLFKKLSLILIIPALLSLNSNSKLESLKIGANAPLINYKMKEVSGEEFSLNDLNQKNGLLIIFSCNTCPFVVGNKSIDGW